MRTIEVDNVTYDHLKRLSEIIDMDIDDLLYNAVSDNVLEDYYKAEIRDKEDNL